MCGTVGESETPHNRLRRAPVPVVFVHQRTTKNDPVGFAITPTSDRPVHPISEPRRSFARHHARPRRRAGASWPGHLGQGIWARASEPGHPDRGIRTGASGPGHQGGPYPTDGDAASVPRAAFQDKPPKPGTNRPLLDLGLEGAQRLPSPPKQPTRPNPDLGRASSRCEFLLEKHAKTAALICIFCRSGMISFRMECIRWAIDRGHIHVADLDVFPGSAQGPTPVGPPGQHRIAWTAGHPLSLAPPQRRRRRPAGRNSYDAPPVQCA